MRVIAYCRVSTTDQAQEGVSLEAQRARIDAWCTGQGWTLDASDVHVDAGLSGKRADNRPALQAALAAVCTAKGVLVVYSLSRLARSTKDTIAIAERLDRAGAELVSLSERIDTTSAAGKMVFRLLAVLAEFERDLIIERTRAAIAHKRTKGERIGQVPYGQALASDGRSLFPCADEVDVLANIRRWHAEGLSLRQIASRLNQLGIAPKRRGNLRRGSGLWRHSTVADILKRSPVNEESKPARQAPPDEHRQPVESVA